jgi:hypothetical protein
LFHKPVNHIEKYGEILGFSRPRTNAANRRTIGYTGKITWKNGAKKALDVNTKGKALQEQGL